MFLVRTLVNRAIGVDDQKPRTSIAVGASAHHPCPASSVKHGVVPSGALHHFWIIEGSPFAVFLQHTHNCVTLVVAHPEVALSIVVEAGHTHKVLKISVVGEN